MKRRERKEQLLRHIEAYDDIFLKEGSEEQLAERILAEEELLMQERWEPEEAVGHSDELPRKLYLSDRILMPVDARGERGWFIRDDQGGVAPLAIYHHGAFPHPSDIPRKLLEAMVAAYNREREEEEAEAALGPDFDAKLAQVAGEVLQTAVDKAVKEERERRVEAESALHRLAQEAGVPDDGPDEIVGEVLAKLAEERGKRAKGEAALIRLAEGARTAVAWRRLENGVLSLLTDPDEVVGEALAKIARLSESGYARAADPTVDEIVDLGPARSQPFADAVAALAEVRRSFSEAVRNGVKEGSFTTKKGAVMVELQWPWHGGYRFSVEARYNPKPVESKK